jgi:hypothetical protein
MKSDWASQKQSLEHKIEALEQELAQARQLAQSALEQYPLEESRITSRRRMLKRLGAAAAGLAVAGVAAGVTSPQAAEAAASPLQGNISLPADGGPDGTVNTVVGTTTIQNSNSNTGMVLQVKNLFNTVTGGTGSNPNPNDAIVAVSAAGIAVNATSNVGGSIPAIQGVQATDAASLLTSLGSQLSSGAGAGVQGVSAAAGTSGVSGVSSQGIGIYGFSSGNYGMVCQIGKDANNNPTGLAPLLIVPAATAGSPTTGSHATGEIYVDGSTPAGFYLCTKGGAFGPISAREAQQRHPNASAGDRQRMVAGASPVFEKLVTGGNIGIGYLPTPLRLVGPPNTVNTTFPVIQAGQTVSYQIAGVPISNNLGGNIVSFTIPSNATGVIGVVNALSPTAGGFVTVFPADSTRPIIATTTFSTGLSATTSFIVKIGTIPGGDPLKPGISVFFNQTATLALDILGYTL